MMWRTGQQQGLTLIETLVATAIFIGVALVMYQLYSTLLIISTTIRARTNMTDIMSDEMEYIRNLQYNDVGTVSGIPSGVVPQTLTATRNNMTFTFDITIRNIDNPADGTLGGIPNDLSPADNKLVEIDGTCTNCERPVSANYSSLVAPKDLETEDGNGSMILKAIDANGQPVADANVTVTNTAISPSVNMSDTTDTTGTLTIVDAPPSSQNYQVVVNKPGYSKDQTYPQGAVGNPNPTKPHLTVSANKVTQASFTIDLTSSLTVKTQSAQCIAIPSIGGTLTGVKLIGTNVYKNVVPFTTSGSGSTTLTGLDWDTYSFSLNGSTYSASGTSPIAPVVVSPNTAQNFTLTLKPAQPNRLVVGAVDSSDLPLADASVTVSGPSGTFSGNTSVGSVTQTDWSGGGGQSAMTDWTKFFTSDSGLDYSTTPGTLKLKKTGSTYASSATLTSSTIDFGDTTTFRQLSWTPLSQPTGMGARPVGFQLATNTDNATWNFIGPDGTNATYYTSSPADISNANNGDRYLRYKLLFATTNTTKTPSITAIAITYAAGCLPPGQIDFGGLANGTYTETVSKSGFATVTKSITISGNTYDTTTLIPS